MKRFIFPLTNINQYLLQLSPIKKKYKVEHLPNIFNKLNRLSLILATLLLIVSQTVIHADTIDVEGRAVITGSLSLAREEAIKDGLRQASYQRDLALKSFQKTQFGELIEDQLSVTSTSRVEKVEVISEEKANEEYVVQLKVQLGQQPVCQNPSRFYRKSVAITGFAFADSLQASVGDLTQAETVIPKYMLRHLQGSAFINPFDVTTTQLYIEPQRAATQYTDYGNNRQELTKSTDRIAGFNAQYVVSGVIRSVDIYHSQHMGQRFLKSIRMSEPERHFVLDLYLYDGFSGALISEKTISTTGKWSFGRRNIGIDNPVFWHSDYGEAIRESLHRAARFIEETVKCQPFMARIKKADGHRLLIDSRASSNIRHGDTFHIYRTGDIQQDYFTRLRLLTAMNQTATVAQVQPHFIIADMPISAENLAVQRDDIVIIW